jgi:hypothetical protein
MPGTRRPSKEIAMPMRQDSRPVLPLKKIPLPPKVPGFPRDEPA